MGVPALIEFITKAKRAYTCKQLSEKFFMNKTTVRKTLVRLVQQNQLVIGTCGRELTYRVNPRYEADRERMLRNERTDAPKRPDHEEVGMAVQDPRGAQEGSRLV